MNSYDYEVQNLGDIEHAVSDEKVVTFGTEQEREFAEAVQFDIKMQRDQYRELRNEIFWLRINMLLAVAIISYFIGR